MRSSPNPWAGRCRITRSVSAICDWVAILARPVGRALHLILRLLVITLVQVAILARPVGRALRVGVSSG
ncbi:MAG: hypothetical protein ACRDTD_19625, partial [Pseudonocardiaceae bacterium]